MAVSFTLKKSFKEIAAGSFIDPAKDFDGVMAVVVREHGGTVVNTARFGIKGPEKQTS